MISCFLPRLLYLVNGFLQRLSVRFCFLPRVSAESRITQTVSAGSHFSWTVVSAGSKRSRTVSADAKYDGQSLQEAKISRLDYTLCTTKQKFCHIRKKVPYYSFLNKQPIKVNGYTFRWSHSTFFLSLSLTLSFTYFASLLNSGQLLTLLHSEWPKLNRVLAFLSAIGLTERIYSSRSKFFLKEWISFGGAMSSQEAHRQSCSSPYQTLSLEQRLGVFT